MFKTTLKTTLLTAFLVAGCLASAAQAQEGRFNINGLGGELEPKVNINFGPAMMAGFAESLSGANPDMSTVLGGIQGLRLVVFEDLDASAALDNEIEVAIDQLIGEGWNQALQVREDSESVDLFMIESGQFVTGMVLMIRESSETVVLANIHGEMDPVLVGRMISSGNLFDGFDFDSVFEGATGD